MSKQDEEGDPKSATAQFLTSCSKNLAAETFVKG